jgi:PhoH-like ATPase
LTIVNELDPRQTAYGRFDGDKIVALKHAHKTHNDLTPCNTNQIFLQESLVIERGQQRLVIVEGPAGTGKTILPLAIGTQLVTDRVLDQVYFCRANIEADEPFGFLPGDIDNKFRGFLAPVIDNVNAINHTKGNRYSPEYKDGRRFNRKDPETVLSQYRIEPLPLNFLRGRSISHAMIIVDEAQHLTREQAKLVVTRADTGTIVVLAGDNSQNDNHKLNRFNNGLIHAWETMANLPLTWRIRFNVKDVVRSELARLASEKM